LVDADVMLYITDIYETPDKNEDFLQKVAKLSSPILLISIK
jgi:GTP-binding protein Era